MKIKQGRQIEPAPDSPRGHRAERRWMLWFLTVVSAIFLAGTWFACATWDYFEGQTLRSGWQAVPFVLTAAFIGSLLAGMRHAGFLLRLVYRISATWLGVLNFCLFAAAACWSAAALSQVLGLGLDRRVIGRVFYGLAVLTSGGGFVNAAWLRVTRVNARLPGLPRAWHGREVVLMSDLHLGNVRGAGFMRRVVRKVRSLKPYAVFISGDMFDGPKGDYDRLVQPCRELAAPAGVYFVTGNHEEFTDRARFIGALERACVRVLQNEKVTVEGLQIVGVHDSEAGEPEQLSKILREAALERRQASILLTHRPAHLALAEEAGISLQLSGHTHKGQCWPWSWVVYRVHGPFAYGLNRLGNLLVLTSSGAGTWGPPMRVGTKSEIVLLRLECAAAPGQSAP